MTCDNISNNIQKENKEKSQPLIVYFSSVTENTRRFVDKTGLPAQRIPLHWDKDNPLIVDYNYVLLCPSYGGGKENKAIPKQVVKFLNIEHNRNHCVGIMSAGNINFGEHYNIAGRILSSKLQQPYLFGFELMGTEEDVAKVAHHIPLYMKKFV